MTEIINMTEEEYGYLKKKINDILKIDLQGYKDHQMRRRLNGFIARVNAASIVEYCKALETNGEESQKLRDFLTINVSEFFRDPQQYETLRTKMLPELIKNNPKLNIWSAGCSIGAEPYSVAMLLEGITPFTKHRIIATDIDDVILAKAKAGGPYTAADVRSVKSDVLKRCFREEDGAYWVVDRIKEKVDFKRQNLLKDTFEKGFDLIICRNVVIYFTEESKTTLYQNFYNSLKENGVFFIGGTETLLGAHKLELERMHTSFHVKRAVAKPTTPPLVNKPIR